MSNATPIVAPPDRILDADQAELTVAVPGAATMRLRVRWSRFLRVRALASGLAFLAADGSGWTTLTVTARGRYVPYAKLLGQLGVHETGNSSGLQAMLVPWSLPAPFAELAGVSAAAALVLTMAKRSENVAFAATVVAALLASPVVWHHYYLLAAAPALLVRNGAWLYLSWAGPRWPPATATACPGTS